MTKSAAELRRLAASSRDRVRRSGPAQARQLREAAAHAVRQALRAELYEHGRTVGRANVTLASFRAHLRAQRDQPSHRTTPHGDPSR